MLFIASVLLLTACIASPATNAISYEIPKDGHFDIIVSQGNVRQATANQIQRRAVAEKDSGIICENNRKFTKVWGSYKWLQRKKITNDHSTLNFPWEQTVAWEISTSRSEMTSIATENSQTTSISIGVEASANFFFGSASVSSDFSYAATQVTTAVRESSSTTTVTKSESETFKLDIPPGVTVYIYEGILQFPGKDFSSTELRLTDKALPDREEVFMKIPITVAGEHQGCVCGTGFGNKSCPNADECCSRDGNCGVADKHCKLELGCQDRFGKVCIGRPAAGVPADIAYLERTGTPGVYYKHIDGDCPYGGGKGDGVCFVSAIRPDTQYWVEEDVTRPGVYYNSISGGCPRGGNLVGTHCRLVDLGLPLNIPTKVGSQYLWIDLHPSWPGVYYRKIRGSCSAGDVPDQSNCKIRDLNGLTEYTKGPSSVYYTPKANVCSVGGRLVNGKCEVVRILPIDFGSIASIKSLSSNGWLDGRSRGILDSLWADPNRHPPSDHFLQWRISQIGTSGLYSIRSVSSSQWLDGRAVTESPVFVSDPARNPASDHFLQWRIHSYGAGIYALQSVSSNCWLDGRSIWQTQVPLITAAADPRTYASGHPFLLFEIKAL